MPAKPAAGSQEPIPLTDKQRWLCGRLDELYAAVERSGTRPSDMFLSALYVMHPAQRGRNPDWMTQAAHSLRELLYPFYKSDAPIKRRDAFVRYGVAGDADALSKTINVHYGFMTSVAHHEWAQALKNPVLKTLAIQENADHTSVFESVAAAFEDVLFRALRRQLDVHVEIDRFVSEGLDDVARLRDALAVNFDARRYFFTTAPHHLFDLLRDNKFFDPIREVPNDSSKLSYRTPELDYLVTAATKQPEKVVDFMLTVPPVADRFNPEVIDRFLWICQDLPADQLARVLPKLRDEAWPQLAARFNFSEFAYQRMFQKLAAAGNYASILVLAESVLAVRPCDGTAKDNGHLLFNAFCLKDLEYTSVFESVAGVDEANSEPALALATGVLGAIVRLGKVSKHPPFELNEPFSLLNKDFFEITIGEREQPSRRDDIEDLAALAVLLLRKTIGRICPDRVETRRIYERYLLPLPDSRSMWCLRLVAMTLCPQAFVSEFREELFRIFDCEHPYAFTAGAEYHRALKSAFTVLAVGDRADYFSKVLARFGIDGVEVRDRNLGWRLLSSAYSGLTEDQRSRASAVFGKALDPSFAAGPAIQRAQGGWVSPKAPVDLETFSTISIPEIVEKLKGDWSPGRLREQDTSQEFLNPLNAEGMGRLLKTDFPQRAQAYLDCADLFFERDALHPHYTYSFLTGIVEAIRAEKGHAANWGGLIRLMNAIATSGQAQSFDRTINGRESGHSWLAGWDSVYKAIADLLEDLLKGHDDQPITDIEQYRDEILAVISELLLHPDPEPEEEAKSSSDPFTNAINSIRGDGFQALIWFMHREAPMLPGDKSFSRVSADAKALYERAFAAEHTMSVMFLFGYHLVPVYLYDRDWAATVFSRLFPADRAKNDLYLAAWEGYLTREPYGELLFCLEPYYRRALELDPALYSKRRYHTELDKGIATHLALAFVYAPEFQPDSDLFKLFWQIPNAKRHEEFVSFIGRHCILRADEELWAARSTVGIDRLQTFWDWALEHIKEKGTLASFGYWMKAEGPLFEHQWLASRIRQTLERTNGLAEWQHGVMESLRALAAASPEDVLQSMRCLLYGGRATDPSGRGWIYVNDNLVATFKTLYENSTTKELTRRLINDLLPVGNGQYWRLKEALQD
jgi:hypothetical protein